MSYPKEEHVNFAATACIDCGDCTPRCRVLSDPDLHIGEIARFFSDAGEDVEQIQKIAEEHPEVIEANRECFTCGHCTKICPKGIDASKVMSGIRNPLLKAGVNSTEGAESIMVDEEYHLFNVYRMVYGIYYVDYPHVEDAPKNSSETLFFPGCPLLSYFPWHMEWVTNKLLEIYPDLVITEECCGSPLESQGLTERAFAFQEKLTDQFVHAGVKRAIFACAGCLQILKAAFKRKGADIECLALPQVLVDNGARIDEDMIAGLKIAPFDTCHDIDGCFGEALRTLAEKAELVEFSHHGPEESICCGSGGAVSSNKPECYEERVSSIISEAGDLDADLILSTCPTCSYAFAGECLNKGGYIHNAETQKMIVPKLAVGGMSQSINYLEALSGKRLDWEQVFNQLGSMWTGEYGEWVCSVLM